MNKICVGCGKVYDDIYEMCPFCGRYEERNPAAEETAQDDFTLPSGTILDGRYETISILGIGGFGIIYRCWDRVLNKEIAVKEYYPTSSGMVNRSAGQPKVIINSDRYRAEFDAGKQHFLAEARNTARFNTHPNIVHVFDFFEENGTAYFTMEVLTGVSFKKYIDNHGGRVSWQEAVEVVLRVLDALRETHRAKIIHRDISTDNIYICDGGVVKLIDFGAACFSVEEEKTLTPILKPGYAPPEQYRQKSIIDARTDIYALGATLYRAISGFVPQESMDRLKKDEVVSLHDLDGHVPENLSNAVSRAMALLPELRFQNVDQFTQALQGKRAVRDANAQLRHRKRFRIAAGLVASAVIASGIGAGIWVYENKQGQAVLKDADITFWFPQKDERTLAAIEDALAEFKETYPNIGLTVVTPGQEEYEAQLMEAARQGTLPDVFESDVLADNPDGLLEPLDTVYGWLTQGGELSDYFFLEEISGGERALVSLPLSYQIPVIYADTQLSDEELLSVHSSEELMALAADPANFALDEKSAEAWEALGVSTLGAKEYEDFVIDLSGEDLSDEEGAQALLNGRAAYYLSDTSRYSQVQEDMAGLYRVILLKDLPLSGRAESALSVSSGSSEAQKDAAFRLLYFLLSERSQEAFTVEMENGLPVSKAALNEYVNVNRELSGIEECTVSLKGW